jgi:methionyl-tRNA synthetase
MSWGIELPFDPDYVTYVWFDALLNYVTAPGFLSNEERFKQWWPASLHLIGKDILTTHAVYWPTMLFSLGLPLPKTIFAHGWWLTGDSKMSKSLGNIINPLDLMDEYGIDPVRYYLMSEMVLGQDANYTLASFVKRYNSDLANDFGNLLNRVSGLIEKNFDGVIPEFGEVTNEELTGSGAKNLSNVVSADIESLKIDVAINNIMGLVRWANRYLEQQAPWKIAKADLKRAGTVLYVTTEALRLSAVLLGPIMPEKTAVVLDILGATGTESTWGQLRPGKKLKSHEALFPRIELEKSRE